MDAHAASSESGAANRIVEERQAFRSELSDLNQNVAFLSEQLSASRAQLDAKEQQISQLHAALQHSNDTRSKSDAQCRALEASAKTCQSLLDASRAEVKDLSHELSLAKARLKEQQQQLHNQLSLQKDQHAKDLQKLQQIVDSQQRELHSHASPASRRPLQQNASSHADTHMDLAALEAKLRSLSASGGAIHHDADTSSLTRISHPIAPLPTSSFLPHASANSSMDKGTMLATMLLEQAREGRISVDAVHLHALRISLDGAASTPDASVLHAMQAEEQSVQLWHMQKRLDDAITELRERELQWQVAELKHQQHIDTLSASLAAATDAQAAAEKRTLVLVADFAARDMKNAHDVEAQQLSVQRLCDARVHQLQLEAAADATRAADASAAAITTVREECAIRLQSATATIAALEQRCSLLSTHLSAEQDAAKAARADADRAIASLRMECDKVATALLAARSDTSNFIADAARLQMEIRNKEHDVQEMQDDVARMRDVVAMEVQEKVAAEQAAGALRAQLSEAAAAAKTRELERQKWWEKERSRIVQDVSSQMMALEVRVQQLAQELEASVGELAEARSAVSGSTREADHATRELSQLKDEHLHASSQYENEIKHLKGHLKETAAGRMAAEEEAAKLKKEIHELKLNVDAQAQQLQEQQMAAVAAAEAASDMHSKALQFIKEQHNHQMQVVADQHAQQKQLFLHTQQELQEKILDRKQAGAAAVALVDVQRKVAEAEAATLMQEKGRLEQQVTWEAVILVSCCWQCSYDALAPLTMTIVVRFTL